MMTMIMISVPKTVHCLSLLAPLFVSYVFKKNHKLDFKSPKKSPTVQKPMRISYPADAHKYIIYLFTTCHHTESVTSLAFLDT